MPSPGSAGGRWEPLEVEPVGGGGSRHTGWWGQALGVAGAAAEPAVSSSSSCSLRPTSHLTRAEEKPPPLRRPEYATDLADSCRALPPPIWFPVLQVCLPPCPQGGRKGASPQTLATGRLSEARAFNTATTSGFRAGEDLLSVPTALLNLHAAGGGRLVPAVPGLAPVHGSWPARPT